SSEPGSVFKPFVIAAAIEEGVITRHTSFFCEGVREIHEMFVHCWNDWGCGHISLRRSLYRSCNLAMADINRMMGRNTFYAYRGYFGFGERTGIDFPGEDAVSSRHVMYPLSMLNAVEMATSSMGQGFNATTIQIINGYAALINGGFLRQPHFVSQIIDINGNPVYTRNQQQDVRRVISQETSDFMRNEMRLVVSTPGNDGGTGRLSYIPGHDVGGKTGTAQQGIRENRDHNLSFVAFLPAHNPRYLVLFTIDHIEDDRLFASSVVPPLMRDFLTDLIRVKNIPAAGIIEPPVDEIIGTLMLDFTGQRLIEAVNTAINMSVNGYQVSGGGTIVSHTWPPAGHPIPENAPIIFYLDPDSRITDRMRIVPDVVGLTEEMAGHVLREAGFTPVISVVRSDPPPAADFEPRTFNAEPSDENSVPLPASTYTAFQQFPAPDVEIEQGTQVTVRVR
ncbi:MAG: penicillin-binding transpeptidase domain-containing protein, partial [Defluviitaleaceae bacterium]|nr:penicillin-binding transpeptidase domain-containing protein [Defluviitaleaceae bacterium]